MEVFSLIKSSLGSEDTNPIHRLYRVGQQVGVCGQENVWRIHEAESIEEEKGASVFIFNKKVANKLHKPRRREQVSEILRHDVTLLNKMSNASVLTVSSSLQEDRESLAFASEPVAGSLANFLEKFDRSSPELSNTTCGLMEHEVQCGIYQITEALMYVHGVERIIHRNVNPASILITQSGRWKLACFGFAEKTQDGRESFACKAWSPKASKMAQPDLNYIAPEIQTTEVCTYVSDMFSFGMLICTIYNNGYSLIDAQYNPSTYLRQLDTVCGFQTYYTIYNNGYSLIDAQYNPGTYLRQLDTVCGYLTYYTTYINGFFLLTLLPTLKARHGLKLYTNYNNGYSPVEFLKINSNNLIPLQPVLVYPFLLSAIGILSNLDSSLAGLYCQLFISKVCWGEKIT